MNFEQVYRDHKSYIESVVSRYCNTPDEVEDVTQDAFIRAYRGRENFRGDSTVKTWLHRVAVNTALNHITRKQRRPQCNDNDGEEVIIPDGDSPDQQAERDQTLAAITYRLDNMPEEMGLTLLYYHVDGLKYEEIAETMGINVGTVRSRIHRARELLK